MMKRRGLLATVLATAVLSGCQEPYVGPRPGLGDPVPAPFNDPQISLQSPEIQQVIGFQPALLRQEDGAPMYVEVPARNLTDVLYLIDYRFVFFDLRGFELEPVMSWTQAAVRPRQTVRLKGTALSDEAVNYRLEIKWAR